MYYNHMNWGGGMDAWWLPMFAFFGPLVILLLVWSFLWKGLALWHSARRAQPWWFIAFLFINTAGILEIVYLFAVAKLKLNELFTKHEHRV